MKPKLWQENLQHCVLNLRLENLQQQHLVLENLQPMQVNLKLLVVALVVLQLQIHLQKPLQIRLQKLLPKELMQLKMQLKIILGRANLLVHVAA